MIDTPIAAACPVCKNPYGRLWASAKDYEYFSTDKTYNYYHCSDCQTIFIDPVPIAELKTIYPPNYYSFAGTKKNLTVRIKERLDKKLFRKILSAIPGDTINVLDVGGGTGWLLDVIKQTDERVKITQVVDIDSKAGNIAIANGHLYFEGKMEDFKTEHTFHLILMLNLIEHVANPQQVLKATGDILHSDGVILIKTPNILSWDASLFRKTYWGGLHCPRHWVIFSENSFRMIADRANLTIQKLKYTQGAPFWAFSIIASWHRRKWVNISAVRPLIYHPMYPLLGAAFAAFDFVRGLFVKTSQMFIVLKK